MLRYSYAFWWERVPGVPRRTTMASAVSHRREKPVRRVRGAAGRAPVATPGQVEPRPVELEPQVVVEETVWVLVAPLPDAVA